jgi:uncharacterized iron-regulated membrane protein
LPHRNAPVDRRRRDYRVRGSSLSRRLYSRFGCSSSGSIGEDGAVKLRGLLLVWHRRVGLLIAALVVLSAVTGGILVFRDRFERSKPAVDPVAVPLSIEQIVAVAVAAGDGSPATDIGLPQSPTEPYTVWLGDDAETEIYLDGRGRIVGQRRGEEKFTRWMFRIHTGEAFGPAGTWLSMLVCIGLIALAGSGPAVALARARRRRINGGDPPAA